MLQAGITPPSERHPTNILQTPDDDDEEEGFPSGLLPDRVYPILHAKEPQPGLRLVCLRDPWLEAPPPTSTLRPWAPNSIEWTRHRQVRRRQRVRVVACTPVAASSSHALLSPAARARGRRGARTRRRLL